MALTIWTNAISINNYMHWKFNINYTLDWSIYNNKKFTPKRKKYTESNYLGPLLFVFLINERVNLCGDLRTSRRTPGTLNTLLLLPPAPSRGSCRWNSVDNHNLARVAAACYCTDFSYVWLCKILALFRPHLYTKPCHVNFTIQALENSPPCV